MKYLGIDYGEKRIGVALSDEDGRLAFPHQELENRGHAWAIETLKRLVRRDRVDVVVLGLPIPFAGGRSDQTVSVEKFGEELKNTLQLPVEYENEVLSTKMAEKTTRTLKIALNTHRAERDHPHHNRKINASSAAIVLQSYLDKLNNRS